MLTKLNIAAFGHNNSTSGFFLLFGEIDDSICKDAIAWILEANLGEERPDMLNLIICSPGGDLSSSLALIDVMRGSAIPIRTIGLGQIASAGLLIFISGHKGHRVLTPNTSIMSHRFFAGMIGKQHELIAISKEFDMTATKLINIYKKCTGLSEKEINEKLLPPQDVYLSAKEALKLGVTDIVSELK